MSNVTLKRIRKLGISIPSAHVECDVKAILKNVTCRYQAHVECELRVSDIALYVDTIAHVCSYQKDKKLYDIAMSITRRRGKANFKGLREVTRRQ